MSSRGTSTSTRSRLNILSLNSKNNKKFSFKPHTDMTDTYSVVLPASIGSTDSTDKVLKIDSSANSSAICDWTYPGVEQHSTGTITFKVTVATKTSAHRYHNIDGASPSGYLIDGKHSPYIDMIPGKTYRFDQSDSSNANAGGHPIKFYTTATKDSGTEYTTGVTTSSATIGTTGSYVEIVVSDSTPALLFYQCQNHGLMGNQIQVKGVGGSGGGGSALTIQDEGSALSTAATTLNFVGSGVTASGTGAEKTITISGGGGGSDLTIQDEGSALSTAATTLNFVGSGVTASGTGAEKTITISGGGSGTSLPSQTGNADKFLKTDGSSLTWATPSGGSGSGGSPIYAHLQPVARDVDNSINDNEVEYLPIDNSKPPEGVSSYSVGGITLTTDSKGIKLPSNGDYKMDFNINVRRNGSATEFWGELHKDDTMIQNTSSFVRQVHGTTYNTLVLTAIVKVEDYANEVYKFKVGAGQLTNSGEVWGNESGNNAIRGSQVTIMKVSDMGGSALTIEDEGSALSTAATTLNFVGSGVTASGTGAEKTITISGGGSSPDAFPSVTLPNDKQLQYKMLTGRVLINIPAISGSTYSIGNGATLFNDGTSDLEATITPSTSSSQILVSVNLFGEAEYPKNTFMTLEKTVNGVSTLIKPSGNTSTLGLFSFRHEYPSGTAEYSSTAEAGCFRYVDVLSSQLPVTYKVVLCNESTNDVTKFWTNGSEDLATEDRGLSIITAQEVSSARSFTTANPLLANPSTADKGKIVTVNSTGTDLQYGPKVLKHNMNFKNIFEHGSFQIPASTANNNPAVHPVMNITITPQLTTSKVIITVNIMGEIVDDRTWDTVAYLRKTINGVSTDILPPQDSQNTNGNRGLGQFVRTYQETNSHSTMEVCNFHYIDEPNTISTVTYNVLIVCNVLRSFKYNRTASHEDNPRRNNADAEFGMSFISAEEKFANDDGAVGAITSFTQEQALAGAGGTATFTATSSTLHMSNTYPLIPGIHNNVINKDNTPDNNGVRPWTVLSGTTGFFAYEFTTPQIVTKYRLWSRGDANNQDPKAWELRAAADSATYNSGNGTYTVLDSQSNATLRTWSTGGDLAASDNLDKSSLYHVNTVGAFKYFVLHVTDIIDPSQDIITLSEWALYGGGFTIPSQVGNAGKQLITNGTSLTWGSPSSILVPSPTGNANKVLQANSAGTGLEYDNAGLIIQVQHVRISDEVVINNTSDISTTAANITGLSIDFTPKKSNSKILIQAMINGSNRHVTTYGFKRDGNLLATPSETNNNSSGSISTFYNTVNSADTMYNNFIEWYDDATNTNQRTYQAAGVSGWYSDQNTLTINDSAIGVGSFSSMTIYEIAQ